MTELRSSGFYRKSIGERISVLVERGLLDERSARLLQEGSALLPASIADKMIENVIGVFGLPLAVVPDIQVNGKNYFVPMVVEEPSIVAGVNGASKLVAKSGGVSAQAKEALLCGQIQIPRVEDPEGLIEKFAERKTDILDCANELQPRLKERGGGARELEFHSYRDRGGKWNVVVHLLVDTRDAMGANIVNTMCEGLAPAIESLAEARTGLKILSNLADRALVSAEATMPLDVLGGKRDRAEALRDGVVAANEFAVANPHRAATHNKGIMNGIDAVAIATGNDWRAIEAGAHAYAAREGAYRSLTEWRVNSSGDLVGRICLPLKVGTVGGSLTANPGAVLGIGICNVDSAPELAQLFAAVGLLQNFAALRALVTEGIQKGHMRLHARSVAASINTPSEHFEKVVAGLVRSGEVKRWKAVEILDELNRPDPVDKQKIAAPVNEGTAAGKIILLGEHAVVYGKRALAVPIREAIGARVREIDARGIRVRIPDWGIDRRLTPGADSGDGLAKLLTFVMRRLDVVERNFDIEIRARIPAGMGLGSSASLAVAATRAFAVLLGKPLDDEAVNDIAFDCEKIAHGAPSGIDNTVAVFARPMLFQRNADPEFKPVRLREDLPLVIAMGKQRGSTLEQVAGVRSRYEANKAAFERVFEHIDELAISGAAAIEECDYATLGTVMNVCQGMLNALRVSTPDLENMIHIAREYGALGAKLTGAGGGGAIVALCPGTCREVSDALRSAGYDILNTQTDSNR